MNKTLRCESSPSEPVNVGQTGPPLEQAFVVLSIDKAWQLYHSAADGLAGSSSADIRDQAVIDVTGLLLQEGAVEAHPVSLPRSVYEALGRLGCVEPTEASSSTQELKINRSDYPRKHRMRLPILHLGRIRSVLS
jgi:hypothetical protein